MAYREERMGNRFLYEAEVRDAALRRAPSRAATARRRAPSAGAPPSLAPLGSRSPSLPPSLPASPPLSSPPSPARPPARPPSRPLKKHKLEVLNRRIANAGASVVQMPPKGFGELGRNVKR